MTHGVTTSGEKSNPFFSPVKDWINSPAEMTIKMFLGYFMNDLTPLCCAELGLAYPLFPWETKGGRTSLFSLELQTWDVIVPQECVFYPFFSEKCTHWLLSIIFRK